MASLGFNNLRYFGQYIHTLKIILFYFRLLDPSQNPTSARLSESTNITGIVGTVLHVAAWIIALVMDIILMGKLKYDKTAAEDTAMDSPDFTIHLANSFEVLLADVRIHFDHEFAQVLIPIVELDLDQNVSCLIDARLQETRPIR